MASYSELYTVFRKKNLIDEAENIDELEGYQHTKNIGLSLKSPEVLPIEELPTNTDSVTSISETDNDKVYYSSEESESEELIAKKSMVKKPESPAECSKSSTPISKKTPP